jgi:hypothetical protein
MTGTHAVRLHGEEIDYGNLTGLIGTWQTSSGFNMIAVPNQEGGFQLLVAPINETLTVTAITATTPNRGLTKIENIPTLQYQTTVSDANTGALMHVECGFWEAPDPSLNDNFDIFRLASIPHGNAVEAMGTSSVTAGPPEIDTTLSGLPTGDLPGGFGYLDRYQTSAIPGFSPHSPNQALAAYLQNQEQQQNLTVTKTVTLQVSTANKGGIENIASINSNTPTPAMDAIFWIETLVDPHGNEFQQLQYSQRVMIDFPISSNTPGQTITWPHISVNTLKRVS